MEKLKLIKFDGKKIKGLPLFFSKIYLIDLSINTIRLLKNCFIHTKRKKAKETTVKSKIKIGIKLFILLSILK